MVNLLSSPFPECDDCCGTSLKQLRSYCFFPHTIKDWNDLRDSLISSAEMSDDCVSKFASVVRARDEYYPQSQPLVNSGQFDVSPVNYNYDSYTFCVLC